MKVNTICPVCKKPFYSKPSHLKKYKNVCCSRDCGKEMQRKRMTGEGNHQFGLRGHLNASFKSGITKKKNDSQVDYWIYVPQHPFANPNGRVKYHRFIVEKNAAYFSPDAFVIINGNAYLKPELFVHHKDGNHDNNALENLQVVTRAEHRRIHNEMNPQQRDAITGRFVKSSNVKFKLLSKEAKKPFRATTGSAGYDLFAARVEDKGDSVVYYTDISTELSDGFAGLLFPRSSVVKTKMHLGNSVGLLDRDFRGNISFVFYKRNGCRLYDVGDRIGQLVIVQIPQVEFVEVDELSETERGTGGYGSTGK